MKNLFFFNKNIFLWVLLLPSLAQLQAQELKIEEYKSLKDDLEKRIKANESAHGSSFTNLSSINSKLKNTYKDTTEINELVKILTKVLDTIKSNNEDRAIVVKINDVFKRKLKPLIDNNNIILRSKTESDSIKILSLKITKLQEELDEKYSILWLIIPTSLALLFLSLGIAFFIKNKEKSKIVKDLEDRTYKLKFENKNLQNTLNDNERTNNINQQRQTDNVKLISELRSENSELREAINSKNKEIYWNSDKANATQAVKVYYFSTPQPDGTFNDSNKSDIFIATSSMYKFTLLSSNKANFEFINDESTLRDALNYPDSYLLPVCRAENTRNIKATKIMTIGKGGIAELNDGRWIVTEKAVIRYD